MFAAHFAPGATFLPSHLGFVFDQCSHVTDHDGGLVLLGNNFGPNTREILQFPVVFQNIVVCFDAPAQMVHRFGLLIGQQCGRHIGNQNFLVPIGQSDLDHAETQDRARGPIFEPGAW